ncbi:TPR domain protein, putative component of TonB system [hydrothermal vent metagenome]|uniref:TPR domain protein, putative component of TonB system n=1 Tax=hydrothermal vent metagenome TaxID=652676 RepID=A0A3B0Z9U6_9ZZZZ
MNTIQKSLFLFILFAISACTLVPKDSAPTLKSLEERTITLEQLDRIEEHTPIQVNTAKAKQSYQTLLENTHDEALRRRAMQRIADLELMENDEPQDETEALPSVVNEDEKYHKAVALYENILNVSPNRKNNDRILYQLSRAYDQLGEIEKSLTILTKLVTQYPDTEFYDEAQFRRGELSFTFQEFADAEYAYKEALRKQQNSHFFERATYKLAWSIYKQNRYSEALIPFIALVDYKLGNTRLGDNLDHYDFLSQGDKELLLDALRIISICFSELDGTASLTEYFSERQAPNYEFLMYRSLGDFFLQQERYLDAAEAYLSFGAVRPTHPQNLVLLIEAIELYQAKGFTQKVLETKKELVNRHTAYATFWLNNTHHGYNDYLIRSDSELDKRIIDYVANTVEELGRYHHALAQKNKKPIDYAEAIHWYQTFTRSFLQHPKTPEINFLLGEALFEDQQYSEAIREYEKTAYNYTHHKLGAEAGYAALLAYEEQLKLSGEDSDRDFWGRLSIQSAQRFTKLYPRDPRTTSVLISVVNTLFEKQQYKQATLFAKRILTITPASETKAHRQALLVLAHASFEDARFSEAEEMYTRAINLTAEDDESRAALYERLAASIYKQGEHLREQGSIDASTQTFLRIATIAPNTDIAIAAEYDAASNLINQEKWAEVIPVLERFKNNHPQHNLYSNVINNLALAYLESKSWLKAAEYIEIISTSDADEETRRDALWQTAELYTKGKNYEQAITKYREYNKLYADSLTTQIETRTQMIELHDKLGQAKETHQIQREIVALVDPKATNYSDEIRSIAATAALVLATPVHRTFTQTHIRAPLKQTISEKKKAMEAALKAFNTAAEYNIAEIATASTFHIGDIYYQFSQELLDSERPEGLSEEALDQYELILEDQAYPFEEKAIEIHLSNTNLITANLYDQWIKSSFSALAKLLPARFGKIEMAEEFILNIQ